MFDVWMYWLVCLNKLRWLSGFSHSLTGFRLQALNGKADCCFGRLGQVLLVFDLAKFKLAGFRF